MPNIEQMIAHLEARDKFFTPKPWGKEMDPEIVLMMDGLMCGNPGKVFTVKQIRVCLGNVVMGASNDTMSRYLNNCEYVQLLTKKEKLKKYLSVAPPLESTFESDDRWENDDLGKQAAEDFRELVRTRGNYKKRVVRKF